MVGIRIEDVPDEKVIEMDKYFTSLATQNHTETKFALFLGPLYSFVDWLFPFLQMSPRGNCAQWTSKGLEKAGVITRTSMWPKSIWINIFENADKTTAGGYNNINTVYYNRIRHAALSYGVNAAPIEAVAPFQSLRNFFYFDLKNFCNAVVEVPEGTMEAEVTLQQPKYKPSQWRNLVNHSYFISGSILLTGFILSAQVRGFRRRMSEAIFQRFFGDVETTTSTRMWKGNEGKAWWRRRSEKDFDDQKFQDDPKFQKLMRRYRQLKDLLNKKDKKE
eukprot:TRINITY_DN4124_c0_g1_i2.p1 TRINITY_DN4124_c0_g1~~TRINITY_DN4124_c0_g1_i2.p1  ORF type:complete len:276 (-),score=79.08 TRINITY_DN4124_c0_g1_i2:130-957(-)